MNDPSRVKSTIVVIHGLVIGINDDSLCRLQGISIRVMAIVSPIFILFIVVASVQHYVLPRALRTPFLFLSGLVFAALINLYGALFLLISMTLAFAFGRAVGAAKSPNGRRLMLTVLILIELSGLLFFKIYRLFIEPVRISFGPQTSDILDFMLPVGISFYALRSILYVLSVYRSAQNMETNFFVVGSYVGMYPFQIAGPIYSPEQMIRQIKRAARPSERRVRIGLREMARGLFEKIILANNFGHLAQFIIQEDQLIHYEAISVSVLTAFVLYIDILAYLHIAGGMALLLGFRKVPDRRTKNPVPLVPFALQTTSTPQALLTCLLFSLWLGLSDLFLVGVALFCAPSLIRGIGRRIGAKTDRSVTKVRQGGGEVGATLFRGLRAGAVRLYLSLAATFFWLKDWRQVSDFLAKMFAFGGLRKVISDFNNIFYFAYQNLEIIPALFKYSALLGLAVWIVTQVRVHYKRKNRMRTLRENKCTGSFVPAVLLIVWLMASYWVEWSLFGESYPFLLIRF